MIILLLSITLVWHSPPADSFAVYRDTTCIAITKESEFVVNDIWGGYHDQSYNVVAMFPNTKYLTGINKNGHYISGISTGKAVGSETVSVLRLDWSDGAAHTIDTMLVLESEYILGCAIERAPNGQEVCLERWFPMWIDHKQYYVRHVVIMRLPAADWDINLEDMTAVCLQDYNHDGVVNLSDFTYLGLHYYEFGGLPEFMKLSAVYGKKGKHSYY